MGLTLKASITIALCIAILLLTAAVMKWLYPTHLPFHLDYIAASLEIGVAVLIIIFHRKAWAWAWLSVLFSLWLGYTLFWFIQSENCGCFGNVLSKAAGVTTAINTIAIGFSFWNWGLIEENKRKKIVFIVIDGLVFLIGFLIAAWLMNLKS
jgi:hypothetical protein